MPKHSAGEPPPSSPPASKKPRLRALSPTYQAPTATRCGSDAYKREKRYRPYQHARDELDRLNRFTPQTSIEPKTPRHSHALYVSLKRFARRGGPDLSDLRGYPEPNDSMAPKPNSGPSKASAMPPPSRKRNASEELPPERESKTTTTKSRRSSAFDGNFDSLLGDANVPPPSRRHQPANEHLWTQRVTAARPSLGSDAAVTALYEEFTDMLDSSSSEDDVKAHVWQLITGKKPPWPTAANRQCQNLKPIAPGIVILQPDYMEGSAQKPGNLPLRELLDPYIRFSPLGDAPILSNFFAEIKGSSGSFGVGVRQAKHDGTVGARALHMAMNLDESPEVFDNKAYTVSFTYVAGFLEMYLHFVVQSDYAGLPQQFLMRRCNSWALQGSVKGFQEGVSAFRNAQEYAHELREEVLAEAVSKVAAMPRQRYDTLKAQADQLKVEIHHIYYGKPTSGK